jgi:hypothetical protein
MKVIVEEEGPKWIGLRPIRTHSLVLTVAGLVYIAIGVTYLSAEPTPQRLQAHKYALNFLDYNDWGYVWIFVGVLSIVSSRWPPVSETWGYMLLTGQGSAWALFFAASIVFGEAPSSNWTGVLSWGLLSFMWWAISKLVNPEVRALLLDRIRQLQSENLALHDELQRLRGDRG